MNVVTFSSLYPNRVNPSHGIFVHRRVQALKAVSDFDMTVVAPVPWFPFRGAIFGKYGDFAKVSESDCIEGTVVRYPRYVVLPKIGMTIAPFLMATGCAGIVDDINSGGRPIDLVDAHYLYPDGVAAARISQVRKIPYVLTARGSDVNVISNYRRPRKMMLNAASGAAAIVAVSQALADKMAEIGMPADKIHVIRNGVDLDFFNVLDTAAEEQVPRVRPVFVSVGNLLKTKGHDVALKFIAGLPDAKLRIIGTGPEAPHLCTLINELGLQERVSLEGRLDPEQLRAAYRTADALILMSRREGLPNVLLESLACGTPVLATPVGGIPEVVTSTACGQLVPEPSVDALTEAWRRLQSDPVPRGLVRRQVENFGWERSATVLRDLLTRVAGAGIPGNNAVTRKIASRRPT